MKIKTESGEIELRFEIIEAHKETYVDDYDGGEDIDSRKERPMPNCIVTDSFGSIVEAFQALVGDPEITGKDITTFDPNIFVDVPGGGPPRIHTNNTQRGRFRCLFDRMENERGRIPSDAEQNDFEAGKRTLLAAKYEIIFRIHVVNVNPETLAKVIGVNNW